MEVPAHVRELKELLHRGNKKELRALFVFNVRDSDVKIIWKFNIWARWFFPKYFTSDDAPFHKKMDENNLKIYRGDIVSFINVAFRGASKTARTKLWYAFAILNDEEHFRKYIKVLSEEGNNSKQIVTDIYNMLVNPRIADLYPEVFEATTTKREERMESFTTATGIKVVSGTVGTNQRGSIQEDARPDQIWYEDFESRTTLRSARKTRSIWENMEEARTGLAKNGACLYTCNYISEQGNVHTLITRPSNKKEVMIIPIIENGIPTWNRYTVEEIEQMKQDDEDFEGERLCKPSASRDVLFDRESLEKQQKRSPIKTIGGLKIFKEYNPSHRYASGHDVSGGVGLDSSTSVFIDFEVFPAQVVATFQSNTIRPDTFGDEINRESNIFGACLTAIEKNNHGHATIARAKQLGVNMYYTKNKDDVKIYNDSVPKEYGWHTNALTKPKMLFALGKAIEDNLLELSDPDLIAECMSYTRNDLIDNENDPRLTTRHFDLLTAVAIAWQMKDHATYEDLPDPQEIIYEEPSPFSAIGL